MEQLNLALSTERGALAAAACASKADFHSAGWTDKAIELLRVFARNQPAFFTIEAARGVIAKEIPEPPYLRAWGAVTQRAAQAQFIQKVPGAYAPAASSNGSPKPLYRRGVKA